VRLLLVGAPAYFKRHGQPSHPRDLSSHRALHYANTRVGEAWRFRQARRGEFSQVVPTVLRVNNAEALEPALRAGLGLALQPEFLVWDDLRSGRLQTALDEWVVPPIALHIVTPPGRARPARVDALIEFLAAHFGSAPWARSGDAHTTSRSARRQHVPS
jgi:DNA-binding transcriptional LysR family regulator